MGYQCIYDANRLCEDIMQWKMFILVIQILQKKMERNLHDTTTWWKMCGKQLFSEDLKVRDVIFLGPNNIVISWQVFIFLNKRFVGF